MALVIFLEAANLGDIGGILKMLLRHLVRSHGIVVELEQIVQALEDSRHRLARSGSLTPRFHPVPPDRGFRGNALTGASGLAQIVARSSSCYGWRQPIG